MRPVLLGMNNPLSSDPEHALYPEPPGCTGHRLWVMLNRRTGASPEQYLLAFDRRNLLCAQQWSQKRARAAAEELLGQVQGRVVLVLGASVRDILRLPVLLVHPQELHGATWRQLPHPSGRNPWYHERKNVSVAELLLEELYQMGTAP